MIIVLMGYMGSGKSTLGITVAKVLDYDFIDLDDYIIQNEQNDIEDIFKNKGEIYFRKMERFYLEEILQKDKNLVLALGGGTPCYGQNLELLKKAYQTTTFYLKYSVNTLSHRLFLERHSRPLIAHLKSDEDLKKFIGKHLFERINYYKQANFTIHCDGKTNQELVETVIKCLV